MSSEHTASGIFFFQRFHSKKRTFLFCHNQTSEKAAGKPV